ncbi:NAD-dependent epimerase/dehydratase family protein [Protaetiibacter mangrovi]|uniref:NAD(P)-dependent oxidoreductase n=1 Tax=Protaetiibacter mangrovi TaxID=2970926 RepID=A0ABT1ZCF6_9MICO|nr:NAD(P)-dependent oxidoreductase [Protaetiibacter mangrovi]MCS0498390.1 NAD(P)-dependent oxidoreductase [Protaetiibacter mangrovi]TPX03910.1 NAD(P)-dependent oxidoreductase [Schumannella luteola]
MIVVVTGATGAAGRAVCARLGERGDTVIAVGTDAGRLSGVDADERRVADLTDPDAVRALAADLGRVDAVLHLVGGWKPGDSPEADAWLRPRLVDTLANVVEAFEPALAASEGRLAIVSSTAVRPDDEQASSYARAKAEAEELVAELGDRLAVDGGAATVFVIGSLGEEGTPAAVLAERLSAWLAADADAVNGARLTV